MEWVQGDYWNRSDFCPPVFILKIRVHCTSKHLRIPPNFSCKLLLYFLAIKWRMMTKQTTTNSSTRESRINLISLKTMESIECIETLSIYLSIHPTYNTGQSEDQLIFKISSTNLVTCPFVAHCCNETTKKEQSSLWCCYSPRKTTGSLQWKEKSP